MKFGGIYIKISGDTSYSLANGSMTPGILLFPVSITATIHLSSRLFVHYIKKLKNKTCG